MPEKGLGVLPPVDDRPSRSVIRPGFASESDHRRVFGEPMRTRCVAVVAVVLFLAACSSGGGHATPTTTTRTTTTLLGPRGGDQPAGTLVTVPNVVGIAGAQAIHELTKYPLRLRYLGGSHRHYVVALESPSPGSRVRAGTIVTLLFGPPGLKCPTPTTSAASAGATLCIVRQSR
jgi:PASTA domain